MRSHLFLVPIAAVASAATPALAGDSYNYMTLAQAQARLFPGASFTADFIFLREAQYDDLFKASGITQWTHEIKAWRVSTGGWLVVDQVPGRDDTITYAVAITPDGMVRGVEVLTCLPNYDGVRQPAWLAQMRGARRFQYDQSSVQTISGTTLSSRHIAEGVKRVLVIHDTLLKMRR